MPSAASTATPVSLEDLIAAAPVKWSVASRLTLAFILSSSLCYLYGGMWVAEGGWEPQRILLYQTESLVHLRAFLSTQQPVDRPQRSSFNTYPAIWELGLVLLEIHLGRPLKMHLQLQDPVEPPLTQNDMFYHALSTLRAEMANFSPGSYWKAIDTCLRFANVAGARLSDKEVREVLFKKIVQPLEDDLKRLALFTDTSTLRWSGDIEDKIAMSKELAVRITSRQERAMNRHYHHDTIKGDRDSVQLGRAQLSSPVAVRNEGTLSINTTER